MKLTLRDFPIEREETLGTRDVRIKLHTVGICGSDVHYYTHGGTGVFQVKAPMILGHEASGTVIETGSAVTSLKVGDRVSAPVPVAERLVRAPRRRRRIALENIDPAARSGQGESGKQSGHAGANDEYALSPGAGEENGSPTP
eukprot:gene48158-65333_t